VYICTSEGPVSFTYSKDFRYCLRNIIILESYIFKGDIFEA